MPFQDKTLVCADCGQEFVHSADEQERYQQRGFTNEPKRCRACREKRRAQSGGGSKRPARTQYEAVCAACGATTTVPFKPSPDRPVYCRDCFRKR